MLSYNPSQKLSIGATVCEFLDTIPKRILHTNQERFTIQVCLHKYFLLVVTMKIFLSLSVPFTICSSINAIKNPIAKIKKQKLKKLELQRRKEIILELVESNNHILLCSISQLIQTKQVVAPSTLHSIQSWVKKSKHQND